MPRTLSPEELETVRTTEAARAQREASRAQTALQPSAGQVKLYDPHHDSLRFGDNHPHADPPETTDRVIVFGILEPGVAIVAADHPLLPALLRRHPGIKVLEPGEVLGGTYLCEDCDRPFSSKRDLRAHRAGHAPTMAPPRPTPEAPVAPRV